MIEYPSFGTRPINAPTSQKSLMSVPFGRSDRAGDAFVPCTSIARAIKMSSDRANFDCGKKNPFSSSSCSPHPEKPFFLTRMFHKPAARCQCRAIRAVMRVSLLRILLPTRHDRPSTPTFGRHTLPPSIPGQGAGETSPPLKRIRVGSMRRRRRVDQAGAGGRGTR